MRSITLLSLICCALLVSGAKQNRGLSSVFSDADVTNYKNYISSHTQQSTWPSDIHEAFYATWPLVRLATAVPKQNEVCKLAADSLNKEDAESLYHAASVLSELKCTYTAPSTVAKALKKVLDESENTIELFNAASAALLLKSAKKIDIEEKDLTAVLGKFADLFEDDGLVRSGNHKEGSSYSAGLALELFAKFSAFKLAVEDTEHVDTLAKNAKEIVESGEEEENVLEFSDSHDYVSDLIASATVVRGLNTFATATKKSLSVTPIQVAQMTEFLLGHKHHSSLREAYEVYSALSSVQATTLSRPLALTVERGTILAGSKGASSSVRVKVTDVFDQPASAAKVYVVKGTSSGSKTPLLSNQEATAVSTGATNAFYELSLLAAKPDQGFYDLEFRVVPTDNKYSTIDSTNRVVKVAGAASVGDFELVVSETGGSASEGQRYKAEYPKKIDEAVRADQQQTIVAKFRVKGSAGRALVVQQAFVRFVNLKTGHEATFVATPSDSKVYTATIDLATNKAQFLQQSGDYSVTVLVGDAYIENPLSWTVIPALSLQFSKGGDSGRSLYGALPEIHHVFRVAEKRPPKIISSVFTIAVLAPILFLLVGLALVGANIKNFPADGTNFIYAVGFIASFGSILGLISLYWLRLNLVQTFKYLAFLVVPTVFFGQKALSYIARKNVLKKTQ